MHNTLHSIFGSTAKQLKTPVLLYSNQEVESAYLQLKSALPMIDLYYALKANNHPDLIKKLVRLGSNFDVCSKAEIDLVKKYKQSHTQWIHTHPIKTNSDIDYAYEQGLRTFVVDNPVELRKLSIYANRVKVLVRIAVEKSTARFDLSKKFGVIGITQAINLILHARVLGFTDIGISFHCGSQTTDPAVFKRALKSTISVIEKCKSHNVFISTVDIGGGFPSDPTLTTLDIQQYCSGFHDELNELVDRGIHIIAEPGRFIASNSMILATKIIGKTKRNNKTWYYIDESVYNSFSGIVYDHTHYPLVQLQEGQRSVITSVIAGQTCDSVDIIYEDIKLPDLEIGAILFFKNMGAYTLVSASTFNGFPKTRVASLEEIVFQL